MSEEAVNNAEQTQEEVDTQETVTVEEMKRRISKEKERAEEQAKEFERKMAEAVEKAQQEAKLSGKELEEYRAQEQQRKEQEYKDRIAELEKKETLRQLRDEAVNTLSERNISVNSDTLDLVVTDTAEQTLENIEKLSKIIASANNALAKSDPPITSNNTNSKPKTNKTDFFREGRII